MRVAIVGAGISGLVLARTLTDAGADVIVFDKGRGVGGRVATRRREQGAFDHGAQRFEARGDTFREVVSGWTKRGLVAPTEPASVGPWFIPVPSANALPKALAEGLVVKTSARVLALRRSDHAWRLVVEGGDDAGPFDVVLVTAPAPQAAPLVEAHRAFHEALTSVTYDPTWALLVLADAKSARFPTQIFTAPDHMALDLVVRESHKSGRLSDDALVRLTVHATNAFSAAHVEDSEEDVADALVSAMRSHPGLETLRTRFVQAHRWRFARVRRPLGVPALFDRERGIGIAGDTMLGSRIESAHESGAALAGLVLAS